MPGINDLLSVQEDSPVRTRNNTPDSMMNYDIDLPSITAIEETLPFQGRQMNQQPGLGMDVEALQLTPPNTFEMDPFQFDAENMGMGSMDAPSLEMNVQDLQLDEGGIDPVSAFASNIMMDDTIDDDFKKNALDVALLNNSKAGGLDFGSSAMKDWFKTEFGIDLNQRRKDWEARKEGGQPFIDAGLALTQASRAGLNVPQAIASAMATFTASKNKLNELDPLMLQLALATFPKQSGGVTMKGFNAITGPLSLQNNGEFMGTDQQAVMYKSLYGDQSMVLSSQVSEEQKNRKDYSVPVRDNKGNISLDVQSLTENQAAIKVAELKQAGIFPEDKSTLDLFPQSARTQRVSVFDNELETETIVTEAQALEDEIQASIDPDYTKKYRYVSGTKYPSQNTYTGETAHLSSESLDNKELKEAGWRRITDVGSVVYSPDGNIIQAVGDISGTIATDAIQKFKNEIVQRGEVANKMATTLDQIDNTGMILSAGGDVSGGKLSRRVFQFADLLVGGTKEVLSAIGAEGVDVSFVVGGQTASMEDHRTNFLTKLRENTSFMKIQSDTLNRYDDNEARRQASNELEGAFYSMALQVAMGPYSMTARAISDKDMDRTLQLIGADAPTFGSAMAVLTSELERSMITNNRNWAQSALLTSLDSTTFVDDGAGGKTSLRQSILITDGQYIPDPDNPGRHILADRWTSDPNSGMGAVNSLSNKITRMRDKYTSLGGSQASGSNSMLYDGGINLDKTFNALESGRTYVVDGVGTELQYQPTVLETLFENKTALIDDTSIGGQVLGELKTLELGDKPPTLKQILRIYQNIVRPKMTQGNAKEVQRAFYAAFGMTTPEQQNLFRNYNSLVNRQGVK
tara:strand:- start:888 stop:3464 length:2577 start_codon:yes stop_codon:yes gene_type:complete